MPNERKWLDKRNGKSQILRRRIEENLFHSNFLLLFVRVTFSFCFFAFSLLLTFSWSANWKFRMEFGKEFNWLWHHLYTYISNVRSILSYVATIFLLYIVVTSLMPLIHILYYYYYYDSIVIALYSSNAFFVFLLFIILFVAFIVIVCASYWLIKAFPNAILIEIGFKYISSWFFAVVYSTCYIVLFHFIF